MTARRASALAAYSNAMEDVLPTTDEQLNIPQLLA